SETVDIDAILALARSAGPLEAPPEPKFPKLPKTRIAAAKDEAFCFYYKDNLRLLESLGAEIEYFSPIRDKTLPDGAQGLVLPGGYPELYARELAENETMRASVAAAVKGGMPCLAECGGFMYLHDELEDMDGAFHPMCGVVNAKAWRTNRLGRFGYVELTALTDGGLFNKGEKIKAHEFHYFESGDCGEDLLAEKPTGTRSWKCIHSEGNLVAGFPHLFYESDPDLVVRFLRRCAERK
ncbi:MAG: cobyrinic acid a,c-diamide synthase, partial [Oscillospiraceae bacterium]|nr:cobyrinic acid a,c-diamide synthase [Oscillospiraceae bacterium]